MSLKKKFAFFHKLVFYCNFAEGEIWICKPAGLNQGKGIFLLRSRKEIDRLLLGENATRDMFNVVPRHRMTRIVQRLVMI